jgi:hypothetical protein
MTSKTRRSKAFDVQDITDIYKADEIVDPTILNNSSDENIIVHLRINPNESTPEANDVSAYNELDCAFANASQSSACVDSSHHHPPPQSTQTSKVVSLLQDFHLKNLNDEWPLSTNICCYWCCNNFTTPPLGIPVKLVDGRFHVFGCFCSLECAAAFNSSDINISVDEAFNRYALINQLARALGIKKNIRAAPPRFALAMFGGHMSIEEFRSSNSMSIVNFPPMMTVTQQVEEINENDVLQDYKYIPIDDERINQYKERLKLKRATPNNKKNTLDQSMKLKFEQP